MITTARARLAPPLRPGRHLGPHHAHPRRAVVIDCETTDLPGGVTGNDGYQNLRNSMRVRLPG